MPDRTILLSSGGLRTEDRVRHFAEAVRRHFGPRDAILFIPWALDDHDACLAAMRERGLDCGYELRSIHQAADPVRAVREAEAVMVGGGNTFRLLRELRRREVLEPLRKRVLDGMPYAGASAGTNVACPSIMTTNDMPICDPDGFDALGLVPFQVNAHYYPGAVLYREDGDETVHAHFGETRDQRIAEFHEEEATAVVGLREGALLEIDEDTMTLTYAAARIFRRGEAPVDVEPGTRLDGLLRHGG